MIGEIQNVLHIRATPARSSDRRRRDKEVLSACCALHQQQLLRLRS
jgi:hypothetical protein